MSDQRDYLEAIEQDRDFTTALDVLEDDVKEIKKEITEAIENFIRLIIRLCTSHQILEHYKSMPFEDLLIEKALAKNMLQQYKIDKVEWK